MIILILLAIIGAFALVVATARMNEPQPTRRLKP